MFLAGMEMLVQMTKKMIEFLISGYEYYENERIPARGKSA